MSALRHILALAVFAAACFGGERSPLWPSVRDAYAKDHPTCAVCDKRGVEVHHVTPYHIAPQLELSPTNLISLCRRDHLVFGHLGDWRSWNTRVADDALAWRVRFVCRPTPAKPDGKQPRKD